jgi:dTDP-4-amino-4,6-dideoxygalactose transaminase
VEGLAGCEGLEFMPEADWGRHTRWLTTLLVSTPQFGVSREQIRTALLKQGIEARPLWKPMHQQPLFRGVPAIGGAVADDLFLRGLCLPSGSGLQRGDVDRIVSVIRSLVE